MLQITAELSAMSPDEREALAGFILTFQKGRSIDQITGHTAVVIEPSVEQAFGKPSAADLDAVAEEQKAAAATSGPTLVSTTPSLDKSGIPWDERIHASSKSLTADGLWRKKRGVEESLIAVVEAELRALMGLPAPAPVMVAPAPPNPTVAAAVPIPAAPTSVPVATVEASAPPNADGRQGFVNLVGRASSLIQANKLTQAELMSACGSVGVPSLPLLANRLDLVPQVTEMVEAIAASKG